MTTDNVLYEVNADEVSHSKIATWNRCRYAYHLQYERDIVPRIDRPYFRVGSAVHVGLSFALTSVSGIHDPVEQGILGVGTWAKQMRDAVPDLTDDERAQLLETELHACGIVTRTVRELDLGHKWETVRLGGMPLVEFKLSVPFRDKRGRLRRFGPFKRFRGVLDWVAREVSTGAIWLVDHKCYAQFQPPEHEQFSVQMATYQYLMREHGIHAVGSITHQIRPELPREPKQNKDGSMSRADCLTDWATYKAALQRAGLRPEDYTEMKEKLDQKEWWRMSRAYRNAVEVEATFHLVAMPGVREIAQRGQVRFRTMGVMTCNGCSVKDLCLGELRGDDVAFLMKTQYRLRSEPAQYTPPVLEDEA